MQIVDKLEDTLNGGFKGLYGEVVESDIYKLKGLKFIPDVIIDLGANVGIFTRFARELFPNALIVAVEPDEENYTHLTKFTNIENIVFLNQAIGIGEVFRGLTALNGSGATYISSGLGYPKNSMQNEASRENGTVEPYFIPLIMPDELISTYVKEGQKFIIKIDVEGNEHTIFTHQSSMDAIKKADYICMEVHYYALTGDLIDEVKIKVAEALKQFKPTHNDILQHVNFWALKKCYVEIEEGKTNPSIWGGR